jgi:phytanoyl-CoA hydroxylase
MSLNKDQVEFYHDQGYLGVEGVLSAAEVDELRQVTDEFVEAARTESESGGVYDLEPSHSAASPRVRRIKSPSKVHPAYNRILHHDKILDIVAQLIGPAIRTNGDKLNMKLGEFGSPVEWHQDWAFYPHTNDDILAVGVCIDEMTEANGCLLVIPESHKGKIFDHHLDGRFAGAVTEETFSFESAAKVELAAGGISIHHVRELHASLPNTSPNPRRLLLLQYLAGDAWPLNMVLDWDSYCDSFLRGQPNNIPRLEQVPVRLPTPPALRGGSIYENQTVLQASTFTSQGR